MKERGNPFIDECFDPLQPSTHIWRCIFTRQMNYFFFFLAQTIALTLTRLYTSHFWSQTVENTMSRRSAIRKTGDSRHYGGTIDSSSETHRTSQQYGIEGLKEEPSIGLSDSWWIFFLFFLAMKYVLWEYKYIYMCIYIFILIHTHVCTYLFIYAYNFENTLFFESFSSLNSICNYFLTSVKRYPDTRTRTRAYPVGQKHFYNQLNRTSWSNVHKWIYICIFLQYSGIIIFRKCWGRCLKKKNWCYILIFF